MSTVLGLGGFSAQAQASFKPGYIVQLNGDTLRGQVKLRGALQNASACRFRPSEAADATDYEPTQLRAYGIDNTAFYEAQQLPAGPQHDGAPAPVLFLNLLVSGKARLYSRRDKDDQTRFYLALKADSLQELRQVHAQRAIDGRLYNETQYLFRKLLARAFGDCLAVQPLLPSLQLTTGQLTRVVERYNECVGGAAAAARPRTARERQRVSFGVVGGVENSKVSFSTLLREHNGTFTASGKPVAGVFIAVTTPALNRHLSFRLDALYKQVDYSSSYVFTEGSTVPTYQQAAFNLKYLCLPLQVRYSFLDSQVSPYLLVGGSFNHLLAYDTHLRSEYKAGNSLVVYDGVGAINNDITRADFGLLGGVGVATAALAGRSIGLEVRAETSSGFVTGNAPSPILRLRALLSIALTK